MVIIGMSSFPLNSSVEAGKQFPNLPSLGDFITRRGPYIYSAKGEGVQGITLFEFDNSKLSEAMTNIGNYYVAMRDIPGFSYSINVVFEVQEALGMIGLA
jgi:hypothetical protein